MTKIWKLKCGRGEAMKINVVGYIVIILIGLFVSAIIIFSNSNKNSIKSFANANVGDYVEFGNYPKSANGNIKPIEWQVLAREENKMFVISRYGLDCKIFDSSSNDWKNSEIRQWLNGDFYNKSFNENEKKYINSFYLSEAGTTDNVFLLSKEEAEKYFANYEARKCKATKYAVKNGVWVATNGCSLWWLRSPNPNNSRFVYYVYYDGFICNHFVCFDDRVVRPALWINF